MAYKFQFQAISDTSECQERSEPALSKEIPCYYSNLFSANHWICFIWYFNWRKVISLLKCWIFIMYIFVLLCKFIKLFVKVNWIRESSDCSSPDCINRWWETIQQYYSVWSIMARTQSGSQSFLNAFCWRRRVFSED